jgi:hypothetical protein
MVERQLAKKTRDSQDPAAVQNTTISKIYVVNQGFNELIKLLSTTVKEQAMLASKLWKASSSLYDVILTDLNR